MNAARVTIEELSTVDLPETKLERGASDYWSDIDVKDLALAAQGMSKHAWDAFNYVYRHDESPAVIRELRAWLLVRAVDLAIKEGWPLPERGKPESRYLQRLIELVLLEARHPGRLRSADVKAGWWGVSPEDWQRTWAKRYEALYEYFQRTVGGACKYLSRNANRTSAEVLEFDPSD